MADEIGPPLPPSANPTLDTIRTRIIRAGSVIPQFQYAELLAILEEVRTFMVGLDNRITTLEGP